MRDYSRREFLKRAASAGLMPALLPAWVSAEKAARRPNILFILADDMGYMDSSLYGSGYYETPNIDRLAKKGMMFTNSYSASPLCSPTRASIISGKYPERLGITMPACHLPPLAKDVPLMKDEAGADEKVVTPESRRYLPLEEYTIGEAFADAGYKTGFIGKWHLGLNPEHWAGRQGFGFDLGAPHPGPPSYFSPYNINTIADGPEGEYITDRLTDEAVGYIEEHKDEPFMLFLSHFAVHAPFQAKKAETDRYREKKDPAGVQGCAVMAAMLESLDESVGRVMEKLEELELADNTIVIFVSDNGGNMYDEIEGLPPTNNSPLRGGKGNCYEGGSRVPCVVVWPGVVEGGTKCDEVISSIDFYPTMLEMSGIAANREQILDGVSIVPLLGGEKRLGREAIFSHFPHYVPATQNRPCTWVRKGDWKLHRLYGEGAGRSYGYELYNLKDDVGEKKNLAGKYPGKVKELDALIDGHLERTGALVPKLNPAYRASEAGWAADGNSIFTHDVPVVSNAMRIKFSLRTGVDGKGGFYYSDQGSSDFGIDKEIEFDIKADGLWHEYSIDFMPHGKLKGLRIDGQAEFKSMQLVRKYGEVLKTWDDELR